MSNRSVSLLNYARKKNSSLPTYATGREREENGKPCVTSVTIILLENFSFLSKDFFVKDQKTLMSITTKHAINSPVTFVTHKRFAVLFFLPSRCSKLTLIL